MGFEVESPLAGVQTGFKATYGSGRPVIGILAEYDALTGLSQVAGRDPPGELVKNGCGHGCGHNMLGAGAMAAACAVKEYLQDMGPRPRDGHLFSAAPAKRAAPPSPSMPATMSLTGWTSP